MNSFGTVKDQYPLIDPRCVREDRERFRRDAFPELDLANSYYSMSGRCPDVGWLLLDRASYNKLDPYSTALQLELADFVNDPLVVTNISIVQARCVTYGLASDPNAIYLLQVTNNQGVLYSPWFQYPVNVQYNVRAPAYDTYYHSGSTNAGIPWTWSGMVGDLWARATALLGAYPGLPTAPTGIPEGWIFVGVPLWEAIGQVLEYLGMVVSGSFPNFTIVVYGAADAAYTAMENKYALSTSKNFCMEDSIEYLDVGSGRVPSQVVVYFHRRNQVYGTEETIRRDTPQWQNVPAYSVMVAAPATFSSAAGTGYLWSDFTVRYDTNGNPLAADVAQAATVAAELVLDYFNVIYRGTQGYARRVYAGALPFSTGSLVDGVRWFNTGMLGRMDDRWCGWRTEVIRGYVWPECTFMLQT